MLGLGGGLEVGEGGALFDGEDVAEVVDGPLVEFGAFAVEFLAFGVLLTRHGVEERLARDAVVAVGDEGCGAAGVADGVGLCVVVESGGVGIFGLEAGEALVEVGAEFVDGVAMLIGEWWCGGSLAGGAGEDGTLSVHHVVERGEVFDEGEGHGGSGGVAEVHR